MGLYRLDGGDGGMQPTSTRAVESFRAHAKRLDPERAV
jgi:hypothetical protein